MRQPEFPINFMIDVTEKHYIFTHIQKDNTMTENRDLAVYVLVRTDLPSMNAGKVITF